METEPTKLNELIARLRELTDKRSLYVDCVGEEVYRDRYSKLVRELLDETEAFIKAQPVKADYATVPESVLLAKLWPQLTAEFKMLLVITANFSNLPWTEVTLESLSRWLLANDSRNIKLFIEVLHEIHRQHFEATTKSSEVNNHKEKSREKKLEEMISQGYADAERFRATANQNKVTVSLAASLGETISGVDLHRFHQGGAKNETGFDRIKELLKECPTVPPINQTIVLKPQNDVEHDRCQISMNNSDCGSMAIMKFPQASGSDPVLTCNYHEKLVVEQNPLDLSTGLYRIDATTRIGLYVKKGTSVLSNKPETLKLPATLMIDGREVRPQCDIASWIIGSKRGEKDCRCTDTAIEYFPRNPDKPNPLTSVKVCQFHLQQVLEENRLDVVTGRRVINGSSPVRLYREQ